MTRDGIPDPNRPRGRWLVYIGVALLAIGVGLLVFAAIVSYLNAIL
ncbi:hypothetical protein [Microbacterium sp. SORGH_AS_0888]|nr:hypothetical protein [Microbacterium sp. SORGH_AS_0888]